MRTVNITHDSPKQEPAHGQAAPLLGAIKDDFQTTRLNYSLWYQSPFKGPPTPQVENAWHSLMQCKSSSSLREMHLSSSVPCSEEKKSFRRRDQSDSLRHPSHRARPHRGSISPLHWGRLPRHRIRYARPSLHALHLAGSLHLPSPPRASHPTADPRTVRAPLRALYRLCPAILDV